MGRKPKSEKQSEASEEPIENSVEINEVEPPSKEEAPVEKPKRPKREKTPAQLAAWAKLQEVNKKKFEERRLAKERGEILIPHGRNIDKQSKQVLEQLDKQEETQSTSPPKKEIKQEVVEEEEEIEYVKAPQKKVKKKKKKIVIEQDSTSSDEEIVISRRRSKKKNTPKPSSPIPIPQETAKDAPLEKDKHIAPTPSKEQIKKYTPTEILRGLGL